MEKRRPHYALTEMQARFAAEGRDAFTLTALRSGAAMGLTQAEMLAVLARLKRRNFYKSNDGVSESSGVARRVSRSLPQRADGLHQADARSRTRRNPVQGEVTMNICGECGGRHLVAFTRETLDAGTYPVTGLAGMRCADCGEVYLDKKSQARFAAALDKAVLAQRAEERAMLARVRKKLKLTQAQAATLTGGGHNAFSRYERGEARPMPAVVNLFRVLDKHPDVLRELT